MNRRAKLSPLIASALLVLLVGWVQLRSQSQQAPQQNPPAASADHGMNMPGMDMQDMPGMSMPSGEGRGMDSQQQAEGEAMHAMDPGHHMMEGAHMRMTALRPPNPKDQQRAGDIVTTLRAVLERYKDYRVAEADGYQIFLPQVPQHEYHFNNYWNGFVESFTFDPARPTSLLYKKTRDGGWELTGAMYTAPRTATLDQLNDRVPLSVARWHEHLNLCMPRRDSTARSDWRKFGLDGSISNEEACTQAGGRFYPQIFGWMVHVYPFAAPDKIFMQ